MEKKLISVIIPTFNSEETILRCINSAFHQTYNKIEVIVCDDNSTDNTRDILKSIKDPRLKIFYLEINSGSAVARNKAMQFAKGDLIAFLDSDDEWLPDKLEKQISYFKDEKVGLVFTGAKIIKNKKKTVVFIPKKEYEINSKRKFFLGEISYLTPTAVFRSECLSKIGYMAEELLRNQDFDFFLRILIYYELKVIDKPLAIINLNTKKQLYGKLSKSIEFYESKRITLFQDNFSHNDINLFFARNYRNLAGAFLNHRKYRDSIRSINISLKYSHYYILKPQNTLFLFKSFINGLIRL